MEKRILNILFLISLITFCSCNRTSDVTIQKSDPKRLIEKADWLIGEWYNLSKDGVFTEIWTRKDDSTFSAVGFFIAGMDTVLNEKITLKEMNGELFYIPVVPNQNNGKEIPFKLTSVTEKQLVFENPNHDFPQKISYSLITKDSIYTEISGNNKGKTYSIPFPMKKIK